MNYTYYRRYQASSKKRSSGFKSFFWLVVVLVILLLLLQACVTFMRSMMEEKKDEATLTLNEGSAEVLEWGQTEATPAADAQMFLVGDTVQTQNDSLVTLRFADDMELRLDENTKLRFEDAQVSEEETQVSLELLTGRVWVKQSSEEQSIDLFLKGKTMNMESSQGVFLIANQSTKQYVYSFEGSMRVDYVDRSQGDSVIESVRVEKGKKSILTSEAELALLARESLNLLGEAGDDFVGDRFVMWNLGTAVAFQEAEEPAPDKEELAEEEVDEETEETDEPVEAETPEPVEPETPVAGLCASVTSPGLNVTIQKDAIAIEGSITCGTAATVTVTWAGNNSPYTLGGFAPGDATFRYVADASYGNLKAGVNTYTVVATAADGTQSAPVVVTINAEF
ncbi:FecR domain-containing protein [Candidatus Peregrinibacteria bacterium]|nr:MAG: FecR domain-containing protein [Candidatus Peregrinibacteria bacterium]